MVLNICIQKTIMIIHIPIYYIHIRKQALHLVLQCIAKQYIKPIVHDTNMRSIENHAQVSK